MKPYKIVAFGASNSKHSINQMFAEHTAGLIADGAVEAIRITDYPVPMYGIDLEISDGIPTEANRFAEKLNQADLIIISLPEHNGTYTAAFKSLFDWCTRRPEPLFTNKRLLLLSTTPGPHGAMWVMEDALKMFPLQGANIVGHFSLPCFNDNFNSELGITNSDLRIALQQV